MKPSISVFAFAALVLLTACRTELGNNDVPARIVDPTPESRAELTRVVSEALGGVPVTLADDVLTMRSHLTVERTPRRDLEHGRIPGRDLGAPEHFRLVLQRGSCALVRVSTDERWTLTEARCAPK